MHGPSLTAQTTAPKGSRQPEPQPFVGVEDADFQKKLDTTDQQGRVDFAGDHVGDGGGGHSSDDPPRERLGQALPVRRSPGTWLWHLRTRVLGLYGLKISS